MKMKYIKLISIMMVVLLVITGCSKAKEVSKVIEEKTTTESEEVLLEGDEEVIETIEKSIVDDIRIPLSSEVNIFNALSGGFFYSQSDDLTYKEARIEAIDILNEQVIEVLEDSFTLIDSLNYYEESILFFIDDLDQSSTKYDEDFQYIVDHMMAYKTGINALALKANGYYEIIENETERDVKKAVIDYEIFKSSVEIYELLDEYTSFLVLSSEYLASGVADSSNVMYATIVRDNTNSNFEQFVVEDLVNLTTSYLVMSNMYTYIASADYYESIEVRNQTRNDLYKMNKTNETNELYSLIQSEPEKPDYLIEDIVIEEDVSSDDLSFAFKINIIAYAEDSLNTMAVKMALVKTLFDIETHDKVQDDLTADEIHQAFIDMVFNAKTHRDQLVKEQIESIPTIEDLYKVMGGVDFKKDSSSKDIQDNKEAEQFIKGIKFFNALELITDQLTYEGSSEAVPEEDKKDYEEIIKKTEAIKGEVITQEQRDEIIKQLNSIRNTKEVMGSKLTMLFAPETTSDLVFSSVIKNLITALDKNQDKINGEVYTDLQDLLNEDIHELLGNSKVEFANMFLNGSADEMVNHFVDWVNGSKNSDFIKIDRNSLIDLLDTMGIKHGGIKEDIVENEIVLEEESEVESETEAESVTETESVAVTETEIDVELQDTEDTIEETSVDTEDDESLEASFEGIKVRSLEGAWLGSYEINYSNGLSNSGDNGSITIKYDYKRDEIYILLYDDTIYLDPYITNHIDTSNNMLHGTIDFNLTFMTISSYWKITYYDWITGKATRSEEVTKEVTHIDYID